MTAKVLHCCRASSIHCAQAKQCGLVKPGLPCFAADLQYEATVCKPAQPDDKPLGSPDISTLRPELQQQWAAESNMHLGAITVKPQSHLNVVWQCDNCPAGQPHIWTAHVHNRTRRSTQCPYCSNRLVCLHNSLATIAPDAAQYWNHSKNKVSPEQMFAGSHLRAEWKCPACSWEWRAPVVRCTHARSGCPKCSQQSQSQHPTFAEAQPAELAE